MNVRAVAIDIDGTLLGHDGRISARNAAAIKAAAEHGVHVVLATARLAANVRDVVAQLHSSVWVVAEMGATVLNPSSDLVHSVGLDAVMTRHITGFLDGRDCDYIVSLDGRNFVSSQSVEVRKGPVRTFSPAHLQSNARVSRILVRRVDLADLTRIPHAASQIELAETLDQSGATEVAISPKGVSKLSGVDWVCTHLGIPLRRVLAIGDSAADIPMIQRVGVGVAVAHGDERLREAADWVAPALDGVALALERFVFS